MDTELFLQQKNRQNLEHDLFTFISENKHRFKGFTALFGTDVQVGPHSKDQFSHQVCVCLGVGVCVLGDEGGEGGVFHSCVHSSEVRRSNYVSLDLTLDFLLSLLHVSGLSC